MNFKNEKSSILNKKTDVDILASITRHLTGDLGAVTTNSVVDLKHHRKSPNPGVEATKPKFQLLTPNSQIFFKFGLTDNEICAELLAYHLGTLMNIDVAKTALALYKDVVGIASWGIGDFSEPDDTVSYSILDFVHLDGFIEMCLFDYLIMNEDRHAGNWCIQNFSVAPLFDHNVCFGGENSPIDPNSFMAKLTSPLDTGTDYNQLHDSILELLYQLEGGKVERFLSTLHGLGDASTEIDVLHKLYPKQYAIIKKLLNIRTEYMSRRVGELRGR